MSYELVDGLTIREIKHKFDRCELLEGIVENQLTTMENQAKLLDDQLEVIEEYADRIVALEKLLGGK